VDSGDPSTPNFGVGQELLFNAAAAVDLMELDCIKCSYPLKQKQSKGPDIDHSEIEDLESEVSTLEHDLSTLKLYQSKLQPIIAFMSQNDCNLEDDDDIIADTLSLLPENATENSAKLSLTFGIHYVVFNILSRVFLSRLSNWEPITQR